MKRYKYQDLPRDLLVDGYPIRKKVFGDSMEPVIPDQSIVHIEPVDKKDIKLGAIVYIIDDEGKVFIHRIVRKFRHKGERFVQTWGDDCATPDPPVKISQMYGKVVRYESNGQVFQPDQSALKYSLLFLGKYGWYYLRRGLCNLVHMRL